MMGRGARFRMIHRYSCLTQFTDASTRCLPPRGCIRCEDFHGVSCCRGLPPHMGGQDGARCPRPLETIPKIGKAETTSVSTMRSYLSVRRAAQSTLSVVPGISGRLTHTCGGIPSRLFVKAV